MADLALKELALDKYRRLLAAALGAKCPLALCDPSGVPVWISDQEHGDELQRWLRELRDRGFEWSTRGTGTERCQIGESEALLYSPIGSGDPPAGWLISPVREGDAGQDARPSARVAEVLEHISACIADEYRLNQEIQGLAGELSDRYEELNLIYSLDGRELDERGEAIPSFLRGFAELLDVDLAAFVTSTRRTPIYATNLSKPIQNLDLVLVAARGDLFRFVVSTSKTLVMNDPADPRRHFIMTNMPFKVLACPVGKGKTADRVLVLLRHWERPEFSNSDRNLATVVADQAGLLLQNESTLERLRRFGEQTAGAIIEAVEAKDPYTRGHSERVQTISVELGRAFGLQGPDLESLFWGSIFHDVGKLGIPDVILCKPGRLTPDEYAFIKIHSERSYEILRHIEYLSRDALHGARHHHERFDGAGYPHGLAGASIPVCARIIAVADTYDAITSSRAYRAARSHEAAMAEIRLFAGRQFDPEIVRVFESMCGDGPSWPEVAAFPGLRIDG